MKNWVILAFSTAAMVCASQSPAAELIANGNFETGTFAGWTVFDQAGGSGSFFIDAPGTTSPISGFPTAPNGSGGSFYGVSDQTGPGTHALLQSFFVPAGSTVNLMFQMFVNDQDSGPIVNPAGLDYTASPNQHARVDILTAGASPLSTNPLDIVTNLFLGVDPGADPNPYTNYAFDLTSFLGVGGTFQIRFAEVDNQLFFQQGIDNVSIQAQQSVVPEPSSFLVFGIGVLAMAGYGWRRHKETA